MKVNERGTLGLMEIKLDENNEPLNGCYEDGWGLQQYFKNGIIHRDDGPALISEDSIDKRWCWFVEGLPHRLDGPAACFGDDKYVWAVLDNRVPQDWLDENVQDPFHITKEEQVLMKLAFT